MARLASPHHEVPAQHFLLPGGHVGAGLGWPISQRVSTPQEQGGSTPRPANNRSLQLSENSQVRMICVSVFLCLCGPTPAVHSSCVLHNLATVTADLASQFSGRKWDSLTNSCENLCLIRNHPVPQYGGKHKTSHSLSTKFPHKAHPSRPTTY